MTLDKFKQCIIRGDLSALIVSGRPTQGELVEAWTKIYYEYLELNKDNEADYVLRLEKDITLLNDEITNVETAIYYLSPALLGSTSERFIELTAIIKEYGHKCDLQLGSDDYESRLKAVSNKLAGKRLSLKRKQVEYDQFVHSKSNNTMDDLYFDKTLTRLSSYFNHFVDETKVTVSRFSVMCREYYESINKKGNDAEGLMNG